MCRWGTHVEMDVLITAENSHTGRDRMKRVGIDACIAPMVKALNDGGITTVASCCGHGKLPPTIALAAHGEFDHADKWLVILPRDDVERLIDSYGVDIHGQPLDPEEPVGWQPIETAPKDGTHILAWFHDDSPMRACLGEHQSGLSIAAWIDHNGGGWVSNRFGEPTHWMPLPKPPIGQPLDPEDTP